MNFSVYPTPKFLDDINFYIRKKKFTNIKNDLNEIINKIKIGNLVGEEINDINLPENESAYKERASNSNTKVGKSNGYRLIYYATLNEQIVYLLTVYYKKDDIRIVNKKEIKELIEKYCKN